MEWNLGHPIPFNSINVQCPINFIYFSPLFLLKLVIPFLSQIFHVIWSPLQQGIREWNLVGGHLDPTLHSTFLQFPSIRIKKRQINLKIIQSKIKVQSSTKICGQKGRRSFLFRPTSLPDKIIQPVPTSQFPFSFLPPISPQ
jgi:hypothetical protein